MLELNPKLNLSMKGIQIEQVEETKLLGVTLDSHLSWSTHINNQPSVDNQEMCWVLNVNLCGPGHPATGSVPSWLLCCCVVECSENGLGKTTSPKWSGGALQCRDRSDSLHMHKCLSWLMVEQRLLASLTLFFRSISVSNKPNCLYKWIHYTSSRHNYSTRQVVMQRFTVPMPKSTAMKKGYVQRYVTMELFTSHNHRNTAQNPF